MAIDRFPNAHWPAVAYASLAHDRGDWSEAVTRWEAVRRCFPEREDGYLRGAEALMHLDREDEAAALRAEHAHRLVTMALDTPNGFFV